MSDLASTIKKLRLARGWSLREFGAQVGVTAAYVADIEAERRLPSEDLKGRIAIALQIPPAELQAVDSRLTTDLREWIEERSDLIALLRSLRDAQEAEVLIKRLTKLVGKRSRPEPARGFVVTWESELRAIAAESLAWSVETGGDLFGRWTDVPTILL
jgi:transcriptional regulator with XRE-family HTH domain